MSHGVATPFQACVVDLVNSSDCFTGGKIRHSLLLWCKLSSDTWIKSTVAGITIEVDPTLKQCQGPKELHFSASDNTALHLALQDLLMQGVIEPVGDSHVTGYLSNVFPRIKPDGTARVILNLRDLNTHVDHIHFKMDTIKDALLLVYQNCFFASVDFKHAYFSVPVQVSHRKWLRFLWQGSLFQFTCMPQGYTAAPRNC